MAPGPAQIERQTAAQPQHVTSLLGPDDLALTVLGDSIPRRDRRARSAHGMSGGRSTMRSASPRRLVAQHTAEAPQRRAAKIVARSLLRPRRHQPERHASLGGQGGEPREFRDQVACRVRPPVIAHGEDDFVISRLGRRQAMAQRFKSDSNIGMFCLADQRQ